MTTVAKKIVINEFMDEAAIDTLRQCFDVRVDPTLSGEPEQLATERLAAVLTDPFSDANPTPTRTRCQEPCQTDAP
ncbi:hypothetical protein CIC12_19790 [Burkholderia sp. SG-MS1]|uniref:hypothetical protein n=1 Tax=Paraburkholderia sp. SG-MS1 TaxID=2023741 RepID=UPI0014461F7A|nr:hypothetical protein [Paraburkholderia sp. SG-MS1]NKJ48943.1 hypothetical protein [Paraburkholderia sp. SG-MS1]